MANNVGCDYGTTYSLLARVKPKFEAGSDVATEELELCALAQGDSGFYDTLVVKTDEGELLFDHEAREAVGEEDYVAYKGFKMLLQEENSAVLNARGYDNVYTPRTVTKAYLENLLKRYLNLDRQQKTIDHLVVGVPEIWFQNMATLNSRTILEDLLSELEFVGSVELVSEPAAACAFFSHNYLVNTGKPFVGTILLVDYGGGTLDIALCEIKQTEAGSEVSVKRTTGAGLNEEGFIGKAGMAFMEAVVRLALAELELSEEELYASSDFYPCVHAVENALKRRVATVDEVLGGYEPEDLEESEKEFVKIKFDRKKYTVTYWMLLQAYDQIIRPVLAGKLEEMQTYMAREHIVPDKIAMVGGFCNFYLTQKQIDDTFKLGTDDPRLKDIINNRRDCEKAIAYGAALIANKEISFKQNAPYHLGIAAGTTDKNRAFYYAITKGDEIEYDTPVFIKDSQGRQRVFVGSSIPMLAFSLEDDAGYAQFGEVPAQYQAQLKLEKNTYYKLGFSLDRNMRISIHKQPVKDPLGKVNAGEAEKARLGADIYRVLGGISETKKVKK